MLTFLIPVSAVAGIWLGVRSLQEMKFRPWVRGRGRAIAGIVTSVVLLPVGLAIAIPTFLSTSHTHRAAATPQSAGISSPATTVPQAQTGASLQADLTQAGLQVSDAPAGYSILPFPGGTEVAGQVTLDLCNGSFPSENLRVARDQVGLVPTGTQQLVFSTEAVAYESPAGTAQAFSELEAARASCPDAYVPSLVQGAPAVKSTFGPSPDANWPTVPGVQRLAYLETQTDQHGQSQTGLAVYLRHGPFLVGANFDDPGRVVPVAGQSTDAAIVNVFAKRLAALPAAYDGASQPANPVPAQPAGSAMPDPASYAHFSADFPTEPQERAIPESIGTYHMTVYFAVSPIGPTEVAEEDVTPALPANQTDVAVVTALRTFAATAGLSVTAQPAPTSFRSFDAYGASYSGNNGNFEAVAFMSGGSRLYILFAPSQNLSSLEASFAVTN